MVYTNYPPKLKVVVLLILGVALSSEVYACELLIEEPYSKFNTKDSMNIFLVDECIAKNDYVTSSNFPIVLGNNPDDEGQTNLPTPVWLSYSGKVEASKKSFNLYGENVKDTLIRFHTTSKTTSLDRQYRKEPYENKNYPIMCNVYDQSSGEIKLVSLKVNPGDFIPE